MGMAMARFCRRWSDGWLHGARCMVHRVWDMGDGLGKGSMSICNSNDSIYHSFQSNRQTSSCPLSDILTPG